MRKETKILSWFIGTFLLPPVSWLISAWYFNVWSTEEMWEILFRINIPGYVAVVASIIYFIVKNKIKAITIYHENPSPQNLEKAQKSAYFLPRFFMVILPIYTTLGDFPVLLPLDFIDTTEFLLGIAIGVPIVFLFAIPFYIIMNKHLEEYTKGLPFSTKYPPLTISNKMTILFLLSIIGISVFYTSAVIGILHNNGSEDITNVILEKLIVGSLVIIGLTFMNLRLFERQTLMPLKQIKDHMYEIARGDGNLSKRMIINSRDEIGELSFWFNQFVENISSIVINIDKAALSLSNAGKEITLVSEKIDQKAIEQTSTTNDIANAIEEMVERINSNTEKAIITGDTSKKSSEEMKQSNEIFMQTIESVSAISEKISVISDIARKTGILSINAAIEAARAGDVGVGFAVVAQEIRGLSDRTKQASEEITELSLHGHQLSQLAGEKLNKIIPEIAKSATLVNNIVVASQEQQNGVAAINSSVHQLVEITNHNATSAKEMSASSAELSNQAEQLKSLISAFRISDHQ